MNQEVCRKCPPFPKVWIRLWSDLKSFYVVRFICVLTGKPDNFIIPFETIEGTTIIHSKLPLNLYGNPILVQGRIGNGLSLNGLDQYLDFGEHTVECLGNLALCQNGITVSAWMNFQDLKDNTYVFSTGSNGIRMYIKDYYFNVKVKQNNKEWVVSIPQVDEGTWNYVELSWHPDFGLSMYLNNSLVAYSKDTNTTFSPLVEPSRPRVLLGKANSGDSTEPTQNAHMVVDEMEIWYGRREDLLAFDYILRGKYKC